MMTENTHPFGSTKVSGSETSDIEQTQPVSDIPISNIQVIRKRPDFLAANRGKRFVTPDFVLLAHKRRAEHPAPSDTIRYGITVTKKIGNAVARNRMKRRFRALLAETLPQYGMAGVDHIMIGRKSAPKDGSKDNPKDSPKNSQKNRAERDFSVMKADLEKALKHLAKKL